MSCILFKDRLANFLSQFMSKQRIDKDWYVIVADYCIAQIIDKDIYELKVIVSKKVYDVLKLNNLVSKHDSKYLYINTPIGSVKLYKNGYPSTDFSINYLHKKKMLNCDTYGNYYLNMSAIALYYSCVRKVNNDIVFGGSYVISNRELVEIINDLKLINSKANSSCVTNTINFLYSLID